MLGVQDLEFKVEGFGFTLLNVPVIGTGTRVSRLSPPQLERYKGILLLLFL